MNFGSSVEDGLDIYCNEGEKPSFKPTKNKGPRPSKFAKPSVSFKSGLDNKKPRELSKKQVATFISKHPNGIDQSTVVVG